MNPELVAFVRARLAEENSTDDATLVYGQRKPPLSVFAVQALKSMASELERCGDPDERGISQRERYKRSVLIEQVQHQAMRWRNHSEYQPEWMPR